MKSETLKVIIIAVTATVITNSAHAGIWIYKSKQVEKKHAMAISKLQKTLDNIGPLTTAFVVNKEVSSGTKITQADLKQISLPAKSMGDGYVTNVTQIADQMYKLNLKAGEPLLKNLVMKDKTDDTQREKDIIADIWPIGIKVGNYIDLNIIYPNGSKYCVLSHKRADSLSNKTVKVMLDGVELYMYEAAVVDNILNKRIGSSIEIIKYPEPGVQLASKVTYSVPRDILATLSADPNIINKVDATFNMAARSQIDATIKSIDKDTGNTLGTGRTDYNQKLDGSKSIYDAEAKEKERKQAEAEAYGLTQATPQQTQATPQQGTATPQQQQAPANQPQGNKQQTESTKLSTGGVD